MPFALNFVHPLLMWVLLGLMLYSGYLGYSSRQERCQPLEAFYAFHAKVTWKLVASVSNNLSIHTKSLEANCIWTFFCK